MSVRLDGAYWRAAGPFAGEFWLDLTKAPGPVVALVAPNGTGKTFCLESAVFGACYRDMPTQGTLLGRALARDSVVESTIVYGKRWKIRHLLDGVSKPKASKVVVIGEDGQLAYEGDGPREFKAWAARHLPDREVLAATTFAIQKSGGFIDLGSAARIDVILKAIHLARIDRAAKLASKYASKVSGELDVVRQRIEEARAGAPDVATVEADLAAEREALGMAEQGQTAARARLADAEERERAAGAARALREALDLELAAARERLGGLEQRLTDADPQVDVALLQAGLEGCRAGVAWLEAEERALQEPRAAAGAARAARERLTTEVDAARKALEDAEARAAESRELIERGAELRRAAAIAEAATREIATAGPREREAAAAERRHAETVAQGDRRREGLRNRLERASEAASGRAAVEQAEQRLPGLEERHREALGAVAAVERRVADLRAEQMAGATARLGGLRAGYHDTITVGDAGATDRARERLAADDQAEQHHAELPALLAGAEAEQRAAVAAAEEAGKVLAEAKTTAHRRTIVESAEAERDAVATEIRDLEGIREAAERDGARAELVGGMLRLRLGYLKAKLLEVAARAARAGELAGAEARLEERERACGTARETIERLERDVARGPEPAEVPEPFDLTPKRRALQALEETTRNAAELVAAAAATRRELEPQAAEARARVQKLETDVAAQPPPPDAGAMTAARARAEAEHTERVTRDLAAGVARLEQRLEQAKAAATRRAELDAKRLHLEGELSDWTRLALDFGRDGIQSAEVDSAGPELTELTNDLLRSCHGPRYTVTIETKRATADGKGETDECRVMVIDTVARTEKEAKEHSGGERVVLGEAISLALTMLACARAGLAGVTLIRDESGAALDDENARVYVSMLRRAAKVVRADKVVVVSHSKQVQALCDSIIKLPQQQPANETAGGVEAA